MEMQRDMRSYVSLRPESDPLAAIANFAHVAGYVIATRDLLALDTVLDTSRARSAFRIVKVVVNFAKLYLRQCHDPSNYNPIGYFDPNHRQLWQVH